MNFGDIIIVVIMLWKKESKKDDAFYVNFLAEGMDHWEFKLQYFLTTIQQEPRSEKSNTIALQKRNEGNMRFRERKWLDAMVLYGDSLRLAWHMQIAPHVF